LSAVKPTRYLCYIEQDYCYPVLRPLQKAIRARGGETAWLPVGPEIHTHYLRPDETVFGHISEAIAWRPDVVLVPGNEVPRFLPGLKVEVFHGLNSGKRRRDGVQYHFIIRGHFDLYCTHGPNTTLRFQELARQHGHFEVAETGWCKLDPLFDGSIAPPGRDRPVILFASTFTPRLSAAPVLLDTLRTLADKGRWHWRVNLHPKMPTAIVEQYRQAQSAHLELVETDDTMALLASADAMLCDTSSILSEFVLQHRPVVTFRTARPADWLIDCQQPGEVEGAMETALSHPADLMASIRRYADDTHPYRDGRSSERTLDAIEALAERGTQHLSRKPRNAYRHYKMRRLLGYWRP